MDDGIVITKVPEEQWDILTVNNDEYDANDPDSWEKMTFREFINVINHAIYIAGTLNE